MSQNYRMTLQYEGTKYNGWQKQGNTEHTIQGKLERILSELDGSAVEVRGSGRTDAGVHALGQVASFALQTPRDPAELLQELNARLPHDIGVTALEEVDPRFHARLNAVSKTYRYRIHVSAVPDVFGRRLAWQHPEPLDREAMALAAAHLLGRHDFRSFCDLRNRKKSTVRTLASIDLYEEQGDLVLELTGDGFLYHMVRIIVGTLAEVGSHRLLPGQIPAMLEACDRASSGPLAPACGLTLLRVEY